MARQKIKKHKKIETKIITFNWKFWIFFNKVTEFKRLGA